MDSKTGSAPTSLVRQGDDTAAQVRSVLVLGARGHIGRLIMEASQSRRDLKPQGASRQARDGLVEIDLDRPDTLSNIDPFDVVVNATDTAHSLRLAQYCIEHGKILLETSADADIYRALMALGSDALPSGPGTVVLGAGAFPGLSTHLLELASPGQPLEFRANWSVLSAAGKGTVDFMVDSLNQPTLVHDGEAYSLGKPMQPIERRQIGNRMRTMFPLAVADVAIAAQSEKRGLVRFLAAVDPPLPGLALKGVAWLAATGFYSWAPVRWCARFGLRLLRCSLLRSRSTPICIELYSGDQLLAGWKSHDAFAAGAESAAAVAALWPSTVTGARLPHEGVSMRVLANELDGMVNFVLPSLGA